MNAAGRGAVVAVVGFALALPASAGAESFPANGGSLGSIPDGGPSCSGYGADRDVTFNVAGVAGAPTNVEVGFTLIPGHTFVGDLDVVLWAPGAVAARTIMSRTGVTSPGGCGDASDAAGPYVFADDATNSWWAAAANAGALDAIPPGSYRSSAAGGGITSITPAFTGLADPNGTWTLTFRDGAAGATGAVAAATLTIEADTRAPNTRLRRTPRPRTRKRRARFTFKSTESGSTFECKLDRSRFRSCTSPYSKRVRRGRHRFRVRATDEAGNVDPTPARYAWRVVRG